MGTPGLHGPNGEWEQRTVDVQKSFIVCNRTGAEETLDFNAASSLVISKGRRLLDYAGPQPAVLTFDWNVDALEPVSAEFDIDLLAGD